jgi:repressor LexA
MLSDDKIKSRIITLADFYGQNGRMPSFSELGDLWGLKSKNAVSKVVDKLLNAGTLEKDKRGRLIPRSILHSVKLLGSVEAGFPSPAEEELAYSRQKSYFYAKSFRRFYVGGGDIAGRHGYSR